MLILVWNTKSLKTKRKERMRKLMKIRYLKMTLFSLKKKI